jgi:hypothetical protein
LFHLAVAVEVMVQTLDLAVLERLEQVEAVVVEMKQDRLSLVVHLMYQIKDTLVVLEAGLVCRLVAAVAVLVV